MKPGEITADTLVPEVFRAEATPIAIAESQSRLALNSVRELLKRGRYSDLTRMKLEKAEDDLEQAMRALDGAVQFALRG